MGIYFRKHLGFAPGARDGPVDLKFDSNGTWWIGISYIHAELESLLEEFSLLATTEHMSRNGLAIVPALSYFLVAYVLVTVLAAGLTIAYGTINNSPQPQELGVGLLKAPAFVATVPYHVGIMLLIWPIFAWLYFRKCRVADRQQELKQTFLLASLWLVAAMVIDFLGFVLIKNPWSLTPREFYVDYQPWITLIYISIFISPWIRFCLSRLRRPVV